MNERFYSYYVGGKMGTFLIARHAETIWNKEKRMQGNLDSSLTEMGIRQANWLKNRLRNIQIDQIYSSPQGRALATTNIIKGSRELEVVEIDALKEIQLGSWEGRLISEVAQEYPEKHHHFWNQPELYIPVDGESFEGLTRRVDEFIRALARKNVDQTTLLVSHGVTIKAIINAITRNGQVEMFWYGPAIVSASLTTIHFNGNIFEVECIADASHHEESSNANWFINK